MWFDRGELLVYKSALEAKKQQKQQERIAKERKEAFKPKKHDANVGQYRYSSIPLREAASVLTRML